ncbi:MAG: T9SS type A sorting domain-containing protein, partial [Bacteroidetes bacterium]|nr:T9SS type A sorting domain-containing protein [Bacteroidota bacterium]
VQVIGGVCPNTTAVNEIAEQENSILYPNPTSGVFTVSGLRSAVSGLEIYNMYGERVYQTAVNSKQQTVNLSSQPQGIYFVQGKTTGGTLTRKIAVQR